MKLRNSFISYNNLRRATDAWIAFFLAVMIFFVSFFGTSNYPAWGDDYAAYFNDAIAIAEDTTDQQHELNYFYHPSVLPSEAADGTLKYVWGYPLLLSFVYRTVGFDRVTYDTLVYYKLVSVICLALCAAVLYVFFRRRFSALVSILFVLFVGTNSYILSELSSQYSDVCFMFFSMLTLCLSEVYLSSGSGKKRVFLAAALGSSMWYTHEVRLNGVMIVGAVVLAVALHLFQNRRTLTAKNAWKYAVPFVLFMLLAFFSERFIFWTATGNGSDFSSVSVSVFIDNLKEFYYMMRDWVAFSISFDLFYYPIPAFIKMAARLILLLCAVGVVKTVLCREKTDYPYILLLAGIFIATSLVEYNQGKRYIFPFLPLALLFLGKGAAYVRDLMKLVIKKEGVHRFFSYGTKILLVVYCAVMIGFACNAALSYDERTVLSSDGPYSEAAVEMYQYIQQSVPTDAVIITCKPRALYLNTQRVSIPFENGHTVEEADYFLRNVGSLLPDYYLGDSITQEQKARMTEVFATDSFVLYEIAD